MKVVAIIQARMGSSRLPGKMLMDLGGKPAISHVVERVSLSKTISSLWLATTTSSLDDPLATWAEQNNIPFYRGSENDVLDRYYQAGKLAGAEAVIRITGDCPFMDYEVIDKVVAEFLKGEYDYVCNTQPPTFPDGLDIEIFSFSSLEKAWKEAELSSEREHVTPYIWKHPELFKIKNVENSEDLSSYRWTLDTKEDLEFLRLVESECQKKGSYCNMQTVKQIVDAHPEWKDVNAMYERNEGYQKSLDEDQN